jgi:PiT family inorganic phosphate transporter
VFSIVLIVLTALTLGMTGANNASNAAGTVAGSKFTSYKYGILIFVAGLALGALLEGNKLTGAIQGKTLMGDLPSASLELILGVTFAMILIATAVRLPLPMTQAVFGASIGCGIFLGVPLNTAGIVIILASWAATPFLAAGISFLLSKALRRRSINSVGGTVFVYGMMTMAASFYTAYCFGANTLGLVAGVVTEDLGWATAIVTAVVASAAGGMLMGERVARTVGERVSSLGPPTAFASQFGGAFIVHIFTQGGIPVSVSHAIIGGVAGGGLAKGTGAINRQTAVKLAVLWFATPVLSMGMAWLVQAASAL